MVTWNVPETLGSGGQPSSAEDTGGATSAPVTSRRVPDVSCRFVALPASFGWHPLDGRHDELSAARPPTVASPSGGTRNCGGAGADTRPPSLIGGRIAHISAPADGPYFSSDPDVFPERPHLVVLETDQARPSATDSLAPQATEAMLVTRGWMR